ncbi:MAG: hypothetical protein ACFE0O_01135 [Opitutales bacterium]
MDQHKAGILCFVDKTYIKGLIALMYSLDATKSFRGLPRIGLTDQPAVLEDRRVVSLLDEVRLIDRKTVGQIKKIRGDRARTPKSYRTFFKLLAFRDYGFGRNLFLDTDLLVLNNVDFLLTTPNPGILAARTIPTKPLFDDRRRLKSQDPDHPIRKAMYADQWAADGGPINSGVMVVGESLQQGLDRELMAIGRERGFAHDQALLNHFLTKNPSLVARLPQGYNVTKPSYQVFGPDAFDQDVAAGRLRIHHYTNRKPWMIPKDAPLVRGDTNAKFLNRHWLNAYRAALEHFSFRK